MSLPSSVGIGANKGSEKLKVIKYEVKDGKRVVCDPAKITVPQSIKIDDVVSKILRRLNLPQETFVFQMQNGGYVHTNLPVSTLSSEETYVLMAAKPTPSMTEYDKGGAQGQLGRLGFYIPFGWSRASRTSVLVTPTSSNFGSTLLTSTTAELSVVTSLERLTVPILMALALGHDVLLGQSADLPEQLDYSGRLIMSEVRRGEIEMDWSHPAQKLQAVIIVLRMLLKTQRPFIMWNPFISPLLKLENELHFYSEQEIAFWGKFFVFLWKLSAKIPVDVVMTIFAQDIYFIENPLGVKESQKKSVRDVIEYIIQNASSIFLKPPKKEQRTDVEEQLQLDASLKAGEQVTFSGDAKFGYMLESVTYDCKIHLTKCSFIVVPRESYLSVMHIPLLCVLEVKPLKANIIQILCRDVMRLFISLPSHFKEVFDSLRKNATNVPSYEDLPELMPALYKQRKRTEQNTLWLEQQASQTRYDHNEELSRVDVNSSFSWRLTKVNRKRELWPYYPPVLAFPNWKSLTDLTLKSIATSNPKWHVPTLMWRHPKNCAPLIWGVFIYNELLGISGDAIPEPTMLDNALGLGGKKLTFTLFESLIKVLQTFVLVSANESTQPGVRHFPFTIMNTTYRKDYRQIREFCLVNLNPFSPPTETRDNAPWREFIATADWPALVGTHLRFARSCADVYKGSSPTALMFENGGSSQDANYILMALVQLLEDPYFRSLRGFVLLVEKVFLDFGYPLLPTLVGGHSAKTSPSFLLFMDCAHQLIHQFPTQFELTQSAISCLVEAYLAGHLVPFMGNNAKYTLVSLWDFLKSDYQIMRCVNPNFHPNKDQYSLHPLDSRDDMIMWVEFFLKDLALNYNQKAVAVAAKHSSLSLSYGRMSITEVPEQTFTFEELRELDLSNNLLSVIPNELCKLTQLKNLYAQNNIIKCLLPNPVFDGLEILNISFNSITALPLSVTSLSNLKVLEAKSNRIVKFPDFNMPKLQLLDLSHNRLTSFNVEKCTSLQYLTLAYNSIETVPSSLAGLENLTNLNLSNNKLLECSVDLRQVTALVTLNLSCNRIVNMPHEIYHLKSLRELNMSHNSIRSLPASIAFVTSLESLLLGDNKLTTLPTYLGLLTRLTTLDVRWDIVRDPPPLVVSQGLPCIMDYLSESMKTTQVVERYRLMLVGKENVGKTSLLNILTDNKQANTPNLLSTDGVQVCEFNLASTDKNRNQISVQALDFAGQSLYYDTHQFFIQQNAVYFVVWSLLEGEKNAKLDYWIRSIAARTKNLAPIIIVATHLDKVDHEFGETVAAALKDKYGSIFPNIVDSVAVSCHNDKNLSDLKLKLRNIIAGRSNQSVQSSYLLLEHVLMAERDKRMPPIVEWPEFVSLASMCGIADKDIPQAAELLHSLGNIYYLKTAALPSLNIGQAPKKSDQFIIINYQWLADMFATLITTKHSLFKQGIVMHKDLPLIWKSPLYPPQVHQVLLELLSRFDLLFTFNERNMPTAMKGEQCSLIPALLPVFPPPEFATEWPILNIPTISVADAEKSDKKEEELDYANIVLKKVYRFDFIPSGFFCRFSVRVLRTAPGVLYWRNGILVKDTSSQSAPLKVLTTVDEERMCVTISALHFHSMDLYCNIVEILDSLVTEFGAACAPVIACPHCAANNLNPPYYFDFRMCKTIVLNGQSHVICPVAGNRRIRIDAIVPEIAFTTNVRKIHFSEMVITSEIGKGSYAMVYKGKWQNKLVAIKQMIDKDESGHEGGMEDLRHELFVMTQLSHPYLVKCYGICLRPLSLVSEFMTHGDLQRCLADPECSFITFPNILVFGLQIATALNYMHNQNPPVSHRDLKSPNCLITQDPDTLQYSCKVSDFGLARKAGLQFVGSKVDNPVWLAPEVVRKEPYGLAADVYSFGVILWEMLVRQPFFGDVQFTYQIEDLIQSGQRPEIPESCPPDYSQLIKDCWAQEAKDRPPFAEVVTRLNAMIMHRTTENADYFDAAQSASVVMDHHTASVQRRATYWYRQDRGVSGGECKATLPLPDVTCMVKFGKLVACALKDGTLTLVIPQARKVIRRGTIHTHPVTSMFWLQQKEEMNVETPPLTTSSESSRSNTFNDDEILEGQRIGSNDHSPSSSNSSSPVPSRKSPAAAQHAPFLVPPTFLRGTRSQQNAAEKDGEKATDKLADTSKKEGEAELLPSHRRATVSNPVSPRASMSPPPIAPAATPTSPTGTTPAPLKSTGRTRSVTAMAETIAKPIAKKPAAKPSAIPVRPNEKTKSAPTSPTEAAPPTTEPTELQSSSETSPPTTEASEQNTRQPSKSNSFVQLTTPTNDTRSHPGFLRRGPARSIAGVAPGTEPPFMQAKLQQQENTAFQTTNTVHRPLPHTVSQYDIQLSSSRQAAYHRSLASASAASASSPHPLSYSTPNPPTGSLSPPMVSTKSPSPPPPTEFSSSIPTISLSPVAARADSPQGPITFEVIEGSGISIRARKSEEGDDLIASSAPLSPGSQMSPRLSPNVRTSREREGLKRSNSAMVFTPSKHTTPENDSITGTRHSFNTNFTRSRRHPSLQNSPGGSSDNTPTDFSKGILCTCSATEGVLKVWEIDMDQTASNDGMTLLAEIDGHEPCCFAQVGQAIWVGCVKRGILIFDPTDWNVYTVVRLKEPVTCMAYVESINEVWVATSNRILSFNPQTKVSNIVEIGDYTTCMIPVGNKIWSSNKDSSIKVWDVTTKMCHYTIVTGLNTAIRQMLVSGDFVWCASDSLVVFHSETYESVIELTQHKDKIMQMLLVPSFLSREPELWSASADNTIKMWTCVEMN